MKCTYLPFLFRNTKILKPHSSYRKEKLNLAVSASMYYVDKCYIFSEGGFEMTIFWPSKLQCPLTHSLGQETWPARSSIIKKIYKITKYYTTAFTHLSKYREEIREGKGNKNTIRSWVFFLYILHIKTYFVQLQDFRYVHMLVSPLRSFMTSVKSLGPQFFLKGKRKGWLAGPTGSLLADKSHHSKVQAGLFLKITFDYWRRRKYILMAFTINTRCVNL